MNDLKQVQDGGERRWVADVSYKMLFLRTQYCFLASFTSSRG